MLANNKNIKTIGIVAPSFFIEKEKEFANGIYYLHNQGFKIKYGKTVFNRLNNTTGSAIARANDINEMFADSNIDIIIASDGGSRAIEVLEYLDYDLIKKNPKPLCGFSDITHLLLAVYAKTGNKCIHGIDVINGFGQSESQIKDVNIDLFWKNIENDNVFMDLSRACILKCGKGEGAIIGGWLNAIHNTIETEYFPQNKNMILFWEAIEEEPNRINMMLQSLRLSGMFNHLSGMIVGKLESCEENEYYDCIPNMSDIILDACKGYDFPVIIEAPFGHGEEKSSFVLGGNITINTEDII